MPQTCTICKHSERAVIEQAIVSGTPLRIIAARYGTSATSLSRHRNGCVVQSLARAKDANEVLRTDSLIDHVRSLRERTEGLYRDAEMILEQAKATEDLRTALAAIREAANCIRETRGNAELLGRLTGELDHAPVTSPSISLCIVLPRAADQPQRLDDVIDIIDTAAEPSVR